ncbi:hypothetical protein HZH66_013700 [Vespula vulgaris]|uniref:Uncharacterized protein n=1 Tax=Vespula vulgaris TaxID=7454 RepID=A0A834J646_VESVU|nr:hypothetical protein HZH66_013700 [Vespula vulgaris]
MLRGILGDLLQLTTSPPIPIQIPTLSLPTQITSPSHEGEGGRGREGGEGGKGGGGGGGMEEWRSGNSYAGLPLPPKLSDILFVMDTGRNFKRVT